MRLLSCSRCALRCSAGRTTLPDKPGWHGAWSNAERSAEELAQGQLGPLRVAHEGRAGPRSVVGGEHPAPVLGHETGGRGTVGHGERHAPPGSLPCLQGSHHATASSNPGGTLPCACRFPMPGSVVASRWSPYRAAHERRETEVVELPAEERTVDVGGHDRPASLAGRGGRLVHRAAEPRDVGALRVETRQGPRTRSR